MISKISKMMIGVFEKYFFIFTLGILSLASFNFFYHLGAERVWDWDESLDGVTAYEMLQNHNFVVSTYDHHIITSEYAYQIAVWNFKPPLGWWFIIMDYKLFGFSAFALRFYSAFFCLLSVLAVMWVMAKKMGRIPALISGFILTTTSPLIFIHGARSGDLSPIFTFLVLLFIICLLESERDSRYLYFGGFVFALAFLVYSFAALQLLVLTLVYWSITGNYKKISARDYLVSFLCGFIPIAVWAVWRLCNAEGLDFLKGMISYDLIKRSTQSLEGHAAGLDYYLNAMAKGNPYWFVFTMAVFLAFLAVMGLKIDWKNRLLVLSVLGVGVPLVLFSLAKTKLGWYMIPTHPPFALAAGCLTWMLLIDRRCQTAAKVVILILFLAAGLRSEREIQKQIKNPAQETSQNLLNDFKKTHYSPGSILYSRGLSHAVFFVAEVACGLNPVTVKSLKECLNQQGFLMVEKDKKNPEDLNFVKAHRLSIVLQNDDWMIVKL